MSAELSLYTHREFALSVLQDAGERRGSLDHTVLGFYESLASHYRLIFGNWDKAIKSQARVLNTLLAAQLPAGLLRFWIARVGSGHRR